MSKQIVIKSGYKQTEVGVIPKEWDVQNVKESFDICNTLRFPISETIRNKMKGQYPYYGPTGIQSFINEYRVEGKYALIGEDGDHFLKWRNQSMTLLVKGKFNVNNHAHLIKGSKNLTEWFFRYFEYRDLSQYLTKQGAGRLKLTKKVLEKILCVIPPNPEQEKIVHMLLNVDKLIENFNKLIVKKKYIEKGAMQKLLTGKLRLPNFCKDWKKKKVSDFGQIITGGTPSTKVKGYWNGDIPWVTPSYISNEKDISETERQITTKGLDSIRELPANSVLITCIASIGKNVILRRSGGCNQQINAIIPNESNDVDFLYYLFEQSKQYLLSNSAKTATDLISKKNFSEIEFIVPEIDEQFAIATILSNMDSEIKELETNRDKYIMIKKGMMQKLLTGEIRLA